MPSTPAKTARPRDPTRAVPDADAAAIKAFLDALWAESGVAQATLASYRRDLEGYALARGRGGGLANADRAALFDYFAERTHAGYSPRSNSRLLSTLRAFFRALRAPPRARGRSDRADRSAAPAALMPKALSETQIVRCCRAGRRNPLGLRGRAMFELMYACGLRVAGSCTCPPPGSTCARACCA